MSYLDKNPFNRPTPSFNNNSNSFNTYSTYQKYDYIGDRKGYEYLGDKNYSYNNKQSESKYFTTNSQSVQYKYSRGVQESPFIAGSNPFSASIANYNYNKQSSFNTPYQRDSNQTYKTYDSKKQYSYSPSLSNVSGFTDPYQEPYFKNDKHQTYFKTDKHQTYFKNDKYQDKFKKSTFQQDLQLQLRNSTQNQTTPKYQSNKQVQISKLLQNNPFQKPSLYSNQNIHDSNPSNYYTNTTYQNIPSQKIYQNIPSQKQYQNHYNQKQYQNKYSPQNHLNLESENYPLINNTQDKNNKQDKYAHLIYKPNNLATSDVKKVQEFNNIPELNTKTVSINNFENQKYKYQKSPSNGSIKYLQIQNFQRSSQNGSRNTFINKIQDLISSDNQQKDITSNYNSKENKNKKSLENPFSKSINPFAKLSTFSQQTEKQKPNNRQTQYQQKSRKQLSISSGNSIKFEDFIDIETKKKQSKINLNEKKNELQFQKKSYNDNLYESKKSNKSYEQKVEDQFEKWGYESSKKSQNVFQSQKLGSDRNDRFSQMSLKTKDNLYGNYSNNQQLKEDGQFLKQSSKKDNLNVNRNSSKEDDKHNDGNRKVFEKKDFSKKGNLVENVKQSRESQKEYKIDGQLGIFNNGGEKFRFSREVFEDEDDEGSDSFVEQYLTEKQESLKRISQVDLSQQRESQPIQSKRQSQTSQNPVDTYLKSQSKDKQKNFYRKQHQTFSENKISPNIINKIINNHQKKEINTEQKIDQKLEKYKYHYQKPQSSLTQQKNHLNQQILNNILQKQPNKLNSEKLVQNQNINHFGDFMDLNVQNPDDNYAEQSSFQVVSTQHYNQQIEHPTPKRVNLKERVINTLKNDSFSSQKIQKDFHFQKIIHQLPSKDLQSQQILKPQSDFTLNKQNKDHKNDERQKKYEFQSLDQFEGKYKYSMKESGFDFQEDQFQETERHLGLDDDFQNQVKQGKNNILVPKYGYEDRGRESIQKIGQQVVYKIQQQKRQKIERKLDQRRYISSISQNNEDVVRRSEEQNEEEFLPSFKIERGEKILQKSKVIQNSLINRNNRQQGVTSQKRKDLKLEKEQELPIKSRQGQISSNQKYKNKEESNERKVHRVKIYDSDNEQSYQNTPKQDQYFYSKSNQNHNHKPQLKLYHSKASQPQESQTEQYTSPFQTKAYKNQKQQSNSQKAINHLKYQNSNYQQHSKYNKKFQEIGIEDIQEQNLKQTLKYTEKQERDHSPTFNSVRSSQKSNQQPPVRDSFDFSSNLKNSLDFCKKPNKHQQSMKQNNKRFNKIKYPTIIQHKGSIFTLIQFTE